MRRNKNKKYEKGYKLYLSGLSLQQVANKLKITRQCVFEAFKNRGYQLRKKYFEPFQYYDGKKFTRRKGGYYALSNGNRIFMHKYVWQRESGKIMPFGWDIHHIDGNKGNNKFSNLKCLPKSEHTRLFSPHNNQFGKGKRPVIMCDPIDGTPIKLFSCTTIAATELNFTKSGICQAINGRIKTYKNYKWEYADN